MRRIELIGDSARGEDYALARLTVVDGVIVSADTPGMAGELTGLTLLEAAAVPGTTLAADAVANAIGTAVSEPPTPGRIAVAMSGGVDSAVALLRAGPDAVGVTLRLWSDPAGRSAERVCCSPEAVIAAREACHALGRPHVTLDLRETFRRVVVDPFVQAYETGTTPNPCIACNGRFRFDELVAFASRVGADVLWTGHYARLVERGGLRLVARGADPSKDQSYMLGTIEPSLLAAVAFPLGEETKDAVRAEARAAGLAAAGRSESQEACFLAGDDYRTFLERHGVERAPGPVVDLDGNEVGRHEGLWRYTPGQRRGIGIAAAEPLYAVRSDASRNALVVGPRRALAARHVEVDGRLHVPLEWVEAKLRYRSPAVAARVVTRPGGFSLELAQPVDAVAPGQVAVLYDGDVIVGSGEIVSATG